MTYYKQKTSSENRAFWSDFRWKDTLRNKSGEFIKSTVVEKTETEPMVLKILRTLADADKLRIMQFEAWAANYPDIEDMDLLIWAAKYREEEIRWVK